jgi:hypothetical protein
MSTLAEQVALLTPEEWHRIKATVTDGQRERTAALLLACFAKAMIEGDPMTRMEAYEAHEQVVRWIWERKCERDWKGSPLMEVQ